MVAYRKAKLDDIIKDAKANDRVDDLKVIAATPKKGRKISFIEIKKAYYEKFYPNLIPTAAPKAPTMWDVIDSL